MTKEQVLATAEDFGLIVCNNENLDGVDLSDTNLADANFNGSSMRNTNLSGADLSTASLKEVDFSGANLTNANLSGAKLDNANFSGANLTNANLSDSGLENANLCDTNLTNANLSGAKMREANLSGANFTKANLSDANLEGTNIEGTKFDEANLSNTIYEMKFMKWEVTTTHTRFLEKITTYNIGHGRHKQHAGGKGEFADLQITLVPFTDGMGGPAGLTVRSTKTQNLPWGGTLILNNCVAETVVKESFMNDIFNGFLEAMQAGKLKGAPVHSVQVNVVDGQMHQIDSHGADFKAAAKLAFADAYVKCSPRLLEPVYLLEIAIPEAMIGDVINFISMHGGRQQGVDPGSSLHIIRAELPFRQLSTFATFMNGKGTFRGQFANYNDVPPQLWDKLTV